MSDGRTITIGGKQFLVTADMADAIEAQEKEWKAKQDAPPPPPKDEGKQSVADRIFVDPDGVLREHEAQITNRILSEMEKRENERAQRNRVERETAQFWDEFVSRNSDLKGDLSLAKVILGEEQGQFQKFMGKDDNESKVECINLLADLTRKRIQGYIARTKESSGPAVKQDHPFVEGATLKFGDGAQPGTKEGERPSSLSDIIKARAAARAKGRAA